MLCPQRPAPGGPFKLSEEDTWRSDHTCSYCGSLDPEQFMKLLEEGVEVEPTDKDYKAYLKHGPHGMQKFYFYHLSVEQMQRFVELINAQALKIAYPGHFYRLPFFLQKT